jgi:exosome complex protein LRP1
MELPKSVVTSKLQLEQLILHLSTLKDSSNSIIPHDVSELIEQLTALEGAKLQVALAFSLATLFYIKMNVSGKDLTSHPIHDELNRIKSFVAQLNKRERILKADNVSASEAELNPSKRPKIDTDAASRIIKHHT